MVKHKKTLTALVFLIVLMVLARPSWFDFIRSKIIIDNNKSAQVIDNKNIKYKSVKESEDKDVLITKNTKENAKNNNIKSSNNNIVLTPALSIDNQNLSFNQLFIVDSKTYLKDGDFDMNQLLKTDLTMKQNNSKPQILIYHTHAHETYSDSNEDDLNTGVLAVGDMLTKRLEAYGYNVIHDRSCYDLVHGIVDRNLAYEQSRAGALKILEENPSIEVCLDVHRDGVREDLHLATDINGNSTAKVMIFNGMSRLSDKGELEGLYNPYIQTNFAMSVQMKLIALKYYPDFTRDNYINAYKYNLDLRPKSMLLEIGAQTNTLEEGINATKPLADLLHKILK